MVRIIDQDTIEIELTVLKPPDNGLEKYIKAIVQNPHPVRSYGPFMRAMQSNYDSVKRKPFSEYVYTNRG